jgi:tetratricopeptide (TPR) repeat protein
VRYVQRTHSELVWLQDNLRSAVPSYRKLFASRTKNYLKKATLDFQNRDHNAAIANYQRALEIERSPYVLMALGQVYMQRAASRLRAHQVFTQAVTLLADRPAW